MGWGRGRWNGGEGGIKQWPGKADLGLMEQGKGGTALGGGFASNSSHGILGAFLHSFPSTALHRNVPECHAMEDYPLCWGGLLPVQGMNVA